MLRTFLGSVIVLAFFIGGPLETANARGAGGGGGGRSSGMGSFRSSTVKSFKSPTIKTYKSFSGKTYKKSPKKTGKKLTKKTGKKKPKKKRPKKPHKKKHKKKKHKKKKHKDGNQGDDDDDDDDDDNNGNNNNNNNNQANDESPAGTKSTKSCCRCEPDADEDAPIMQMQRYLKVTNDTKATLTVYVQYHTQVKCQWVWLPNDPAESDEAVVVQIAPGQTLDIEDAAGSPISASRARIWAISARTTLSKYKDADFWLVPEKDAQGKHYYFADKRGTSTFTFTHAKNK
jgi:hypothetical protein